jgi:hypothetical protein
VCRTTRAHGATQERGDAEKRQDSFNNEEIEGIEGQEFADCLDPTSSFDFFDLFVVKPCLPPCPPRFSAPPRSGLCHFLF